MRWAGLVAGVAVLSVGQAALAATWTTGTRPHLGQIFAIDTTGEPNWLYGAEDVLGDGAQNFTPAEQALDLRTAYASTDATHLWTRVYVSSTAAADTTLTIFVFVDADRNAATGGPTASATLSPLFTAEHSPGGYEFVLGARGDGTLAGVWQWQTTPTPDYVPLALTPPQTAVEVGVDVDPIRIGSDMHAYVQARVDLGIVGLTAPCDANLYVRSARASGASDLDMTYSTSCVPAKTNGVPTIVVVSGCTSDAQCPENGICDSGQCILATPCGVTADCPASDVCTADGRCVPNGGGTCATPVDCANTLACVGGVCTACTQGGSECGAGYRCAPTGACVATGTTGNGEVEGGALHCSVSRVVGASSRPRSVLVLGALASLLGLLYVRRRKG